MMIYQENIAPPLAPLSDSEQPQLRMAATASEDLWVEDFINRLAGIVHDMKH